MANSERGEFDLRLNGRTLTLKLGSAALRMAQEALVRPDGNVPLIQELLEQVARGRLAYVRAVIWAGLRKHHPEIELDAVDDLIDDANPDEIRDLLGKMGISARPAKVDVEALGIDTRPIEAPAEQNGRQTRKRAARRGGDRSTSRADGSDSAATTSGH